MHKSKQQPISREAKMPGGGRCPTKRFQSLQPLLNLQKNLYSICRKNLNSICRKNLYSICRKTWLNLQKKYFCSDSTCKKANRKGKEHSSEQAAKVNKQGKGWKDESYHLYPWNLNSCNPWKTALGKSRITKLLKGRNWPKTKRRFAAVQWQNRRVLPPLEWLRLTWKGMKRFEKFALWGEEGAVPLRGGTSLDSHCCLLLSRRRWNREMELAPPATFCLAEPSLWLLPVD